MFAASRLVWKSDLCDLLSPLALTFNLTHKPAFLSTIHCMLYAMAIRERKRERYRKRDRRREREMERERERQRKEVCALNDLCDNSEVAKVNCVDIVAL